jgi:signal transduction histidine kinase
MPKLFPVRVKLAAALAVPLAALMSLGAATVLETRADARQAAGQAELALATTGPGSLVRSLQAERNLSSLYLLDAVDVVDLPYETFDEVRPQVDAALRRFDARTRGAGGPIAAAYEPALEAFDGLADLRATVDGYTGPRGFDNLTAGEVFDRYAELVDQLLAAGRGISVAVDDPDLRRGAELVNQATHQSDTIAHLVRHLLLAAVGGEANGVDTRSEIIGIQLLLADLRRGEELLRSNAEGPYETYVEELFASPTIQAFPLHVEAALETGTVDIAAVLGTAAPDREYRYELLVRDLASELEHMANALTRDAARARDLYATLGSLLALAALGVTWLVSRSITRPLRSLTRTAAAMANQRLPAALQAVLDTPPGQDVAIPEPHPIRITTNDEVADVAAALNTVQRSALDLAVEQAVLRRNVADALVNLGRRNQNLLERQLRFITGLEREEVDPDALASLFRLDHLATRMRRNAESLLVLAGVDPPRHRATPVPVLDVIRSAVGEVEDYHRVIIRSVEPATVVGTAATDLAHLLAELTENALTHSPPDMHVHLRGRAQVGGGYVLTIIDAGIGMPPDEVDRANRRLAQAESFTVAPSRYLGHYVAGHLAGRHGITARVRSTTVHPARRGITATVTLPPALLTTAPTTGPHPPRAPAASHAEASTAPSLDRPATPAPPATTRAATPPRSRPAPDTYRIDSVSYHIDRGWAAGEPTLVVPAPDPAEREPPTLDDVYSVLTRFRASTRPSLVSPPDPPVPSDTTPTPDP